VRIRFEADADLKHAIVAGTLRRSASLDFRRAEAAPLEGLADPAVLALAAEEGRVLVSHDVNTMERHFHDFIQNQDSPGLILIPQTRVSTRQAIDGLILLWEVLDAADLENRVCVFPSLLIY
jgi:predicted nuclease of predicted toxin-antitoxin system